MSNSDFGLFLEKFYKNKDLYDWDTKMRFTNDGEVSYSNLLEYFTDLTEKGFSTENKSPCDIGSVISLFISFIPFDFLEKIAVNIVNLDNNAMGIRIAVSYPIPLDLDTLKMMVESLIRSKTQVTVQQPPIDANSLPLMKIYSNNEEITVCYNRDTNAISMLQAKTLDYPHFMVEFAISGSIESNYKNIIEGMIFSLPFKPRLTAIISAGSDLLLFRRIASQKPDILESLEEKTLQITEYFDWFSIQSYYYGVSSLNELNISNFAQLVVSPTKDDSSCLYLAVYVNGTKIKSEDPFVIAMLNEIDVPFQITPVSGGKEDFWCISNLVGLDLVDFYCFLNVSRLDILDPAVKCVESAFKKLFEDKKRYDKKIPEIKIANNAYKVIQSIQDSMNRVLGYEMTHPFVWDSFSKVLNKKIKKLIKKEKKTANE